MANKYRINGKFASFKNFVKANGLDSVSYADLNKKQKRVFNGLKTYSERIIYKGQFLNKISAKKLKNDKDLQLFAKNNNKSISKYINENIEDILEVYEGAFKITKNNNNVFDFINKAKGNLSIYGKPVSKNEFNLFAKRAIQKAMKAGFFNNIFNFDISDNGQEINLTEIEPIGSDE